jgi:cobalt/nickel transport system permease protein
MTPFVHVIELPVHFLVLTLGTLALLWVLSLCLLRFLSSGNDSPEAQKERDWGIPALDAQAHRDSPFHRWDPRIKTVALMFFMFCTASLTQPWWACLAVAGAVLSVVVARIPWRSPLRRLAAMATFLGMFLVVMPLTVPARSGDTLLSFSELSFVSFNLRGLMLAILICLKASAIALLVEPLLATAPFPVTIQALSSLKVPPSVCQMILLAHRYIFVFQSEVARMTKGMNARGFTKRTDTETLRTIGNFLGMLLVRSFERTQRVYEAMLARGYDGTLPGGFEFHARRGDWAKGTLWVLAGMALVALDRLHKLPGVPFF